MTVHHLDLYRLADPEELELIGARELATPDAVWLVEWPERGGDRLPPLDHVVRIDYAGRGRRVSCRAADRPPNMT
ncbi:MAG: tRNA (adenosine(37)-N6)-threonylcarbamoyltransferase complex ATPase subunit type 1 TsaE [Halofilum sp. (in: g-proteobacteria)]|nr:tRNA (adenosine(37)-N6)-threonylcarbamoyltransferase complex ATPase subunit type 1 TsaE [Halofilum sp. (in: g-proteobacteria)]